MRGSTLIILLAVAGITGAAVIWRLQQMDRSIPATDEYARVICIAPGLTEIIYALGCGDRIAGVGDFVTWPPETAAKPRVGGYLNPNLEMILSLRPDLVIIQGRNEQVSDFCSRNGISFERFEVDRITDVYAAIGRIGVLLGVGNRSDSLAAALKGELTLIGGSVESLGKPLVFYSLGHTPGEMNTLFTAGGRSFVSELIGIAGGSNIFADSRELYPEISKEVLASRAPDIIIESAVGHGEGSDYTKRLRDDWRMFPTIPAVKNGRVYIITEPFLEIPGPRLGLAAKMLAGIIHPEAADE